MENDDEHRRFMRMAIAQAQEGMQAGRGGPFGCVIVKNGEVIGRGSNAVTSSLDPTAHAEVVAIRDACKNIAHFQLDDCVLYTSCEPCPMCLGAIYWARPQRVFYACTQQDAAAAGFDDQFIYEELALPKQERKMQMQQIERESSQQLFAQWMAKHDKIDY